MRRPPPLPTPAGESAENAPARRRPNTAAGQGVVERGGAAPGTISEIPLTEAVDDDREMSARDVWRAARARRKALRAEIRRFTQRSRRRRIVWLSVVGAAVLVVGGSVAAAYSPLFAVEKITVVGATTLDPASLEAALADQLGTPLALVDSSEVKASLLAFPLIETYALEAKPPHDLTVRIVERTPVGVMRSDAGYTLVDAAGVALSTTSDQPAGQPILNITGGTDSATFESAGLVVRSVPADLRAALTDVTATTPDDVTLTLSTGLTIVWGNSENSPLKSEVLAKTLLSVPGASSIDVTSPHAVVVG
ncbi:FtsQ-type POTRA domain-containing protein [Microbacterium hydrocarbonoxydans]|uniref:FtsQ-type POTRA domain-containing protein n=1 Tax=Microbacterium hydrocarbonoxydans TaxID=273678 RepID=UPI00203F55E9|nr:FtsQ-type POTRA domain-containing protein [Microbacterium hydrocarbonoxydans]MCM3781041.1 FtsQ-type POTRA domain-containing protein [Microbacterium hydrocarbonoxydans]